MPQPRHKSPPRHSAHQETDDGYFPRATSILRMVHEEKAVGLMYGQRALCVGAVKPLNYVGTSEHTRNKLTPFRRITHTGGMFEAVFFGSRTRADRVLEIVAKMHERVVGELPEDAGPHHPAGTPYSAFDPELMLWTVAVIADSAEWFYQRVVRPLTGEEREALWQDYLRFAELFQMPRSTAPASYSEFRAWYERQLAGPDLYLTEEARFMGYASAFEIPVPSGRRAAKSLHDLVMLGSLPQRIRELYGLRYTHAHAAGCAAALAGGRLARLLAPRSLTHGSCLPEFEMVALTERRRIESGQPTPQLAG
ncbi:MAG TPA: oxygenase MpaB family protein [Solirubrobacteraceae bacterium]|nr:oxygenase MpaB family protein [Solirubrobacteraceae bacterium]